MNDKFRERALLAQQYAADEEMKKVRYHDMLRDDIREFVSFLGCKTLNYMITRSWKQNIDLEHIRKRKPEQVQIVGSPAKRPNTSDQRVRGYQGRGQCNTCGK